MDENHPYVKYLKSKDGCYCVGGNIKKINDVIHYDFKEHRKSPEEVKKYFKNRVNRFYVHHGDSDNSSNVFEDQIVFKNENDSKNLANRILQSE